MEKKTDEKCVGLDSYENMNAGSYVDVNVFIKGIRLPFQLTRNPMIASVPLSSSFLPNCQEPKAMMITILESNPNKLNQDKMNLENFNEKITGNTQDVEFEANTNKMPHSSEKDAKQSLSCVAIDYHNGQHPTIGQLSLPVINRLGYFPILNFDADTNQDGYTDAFGVSTHIPCRFDVEERECPLSSSYIPTESKIPFENLEQFWADTNKYFLPFSFGAHDPSVLLLQPNYTHDVSVSPIEDLGPAAMSEELDGQEMNDLTRTFQFQTESCPLKHFSQPDAVLLPNPALSLPYPTVGSMSSLLPDSAMYQRLVSALVLCPPPEPPQPEPRPVRESGRCSALAALKAAGLAAADAPEGRDCSLLLPCESCSTETPLAAAAEDDSLSVLIRRLVQESTRQQHEVNLMLAALRQRLGNLNDLQQHEAKPAAARAQLAHKQSATIKRWFSSNRKKQSVLNGRDQDTFVGKSIKKRKR